MMSSFGGKRGGLGQPKDRGYWVLAILHNAQQQIRVPHASGMHFLYDLFRVLERLRSWPHFNHNEKDN